MSNKKETYKENDNSALNVADVNGSSLDYILIEMFTNVAFSLSGLDFEKYYKNFFEKMNTELNVQYIQLQKRFFNEFEAKFERNFTPNEMSLEGCKYSKDHDKKIAFMDGYNSAIAELKSRIEIQKELVIDAIEQGFTLSNAVRSNYR